MLIVALQPTNNYSSFSVGKELCAVREVLNDPEGQEPRHDRGKTFENKYPCPTRFPTDAVHLRDRGLSEKIKLMENIGKTQILHTASKPPNAPDTEAAEKKSAARRPNSERLYQLNDE